MAIAGIGFGLDCGGERESLLGWVCMRRAGGRGDIGGLWPVATVVVARAGAGAVKQRCTPEREAELLQAAIVAERETMREIWPKLERLQAQYRAAENEYNRLMLLARNRVAAGGGE